MRLYVRCTLNVLTAACPAGGLCVLFHDVGKQLTKDRFMSFDDAHFRFSAEYKHFRRRTRAIADSRSRETKDYLPSLQRIAGILYLLNHQPEA